MKVFNLIKNLFLVLSFVFLGLSFIFGGITLESADSAYSTILLPFVIYAFVGCTLLYTKNEVAKKVGLGLSVGTMLIAAFASLSLIDNSSAALFGLVATVLFLLYFIIIWIGKLAIKERTDFDEPLSDPRILKIRSWKSLLEDGIITEAEFQTKRAEILKIETKK